MLLKWLITIGIAYFIYRYFIKPPSSQNLHSDGREDQKRVEDEEGEYIDYEEVE